MASNGVFRGALVVQLLEDPILMYTPSFNPNRIGRTRPSCKLQPLHSWSAENLGLCRGAMRGTPYDTYGRLCVPYPRCLRKYVTFRERLCHNHNSASTANTAVGNRDIEMKRTQASSPSMIALGNMSQSEWPLLLSLRDAAAKPPLILQRLETKSFLPVQLQATACGNGHWCRNLDSQNPSLSQTSSP